MREAAKRMLKSENPSLFMEVLQGDVQRGGVGSKVMWWGNGRS